MTSKLPWRRAAVPAELRARVALPPGERILGWSWLPGQGWAVATDDALLIADDDGGGTDDVPMRLPWHLITSGVWADGAIDVLGASVVGRPPKHYRLQIEQDGLLAEAVRTKVTGSIVWSSRVTEPDVASAMFSARRTPDDSLLWSVVFDRGFDADDPAMQRWADEQIQRLKEQTGL